MTLKIPSLRVPTSNSNSNTPAARPGKLQLTDPDEFLPGAKSAKPGPTGNVNTGNLTDHGGGVLKSVNVVPVYVGQYWGSTQGQADRNHNDAALADLVTNPGMTGVWQQYGAGAGSTGASLAINTQADPTKMTKADVEAMVKSQIANGTFDTSNPQTLFNLVLPPGCELQDSNGASSFNGLGGYHGSVNINGREVYYDAICYGQKDSAAPHGVNGIDFAGNAQDNVSITESHEISETVTDPNVEAAIRNNDNNKLGWYDDSTKYKDFKGKTQTGKGEIGDISILNAELAGDRNLSTAWGKSDGFAFQKEWSNQDQQSELAPKTSKS